MHFFAPHLSFLCVGLASKMCVLCVPNGLFWVLYDVGVMGVVLSWEWIGCCHGHIAWLVEM